MTCLGCELLATSAVSLNDGATVCGSCELWRLECEAREVIAKPTVEARRAYLAGVEEKRGAVAVDALRAVITVEWAKARAVA